MNIEEDAKPEVECLHTHKCDELIIAFSILFTCMQAHHSSYFAVALTWLVVGNELVVYKVKVTTIYLQFN